MRILVLNYEYPPLGGGAANATAYILKELAAMQGLELDLITSSTAAFRIEQPAPNLRLHFLDIRKRGNAHYQTNRDLLAYSWKALAYARNLLKKNQFDVCHAFFGIPCGYIARKLRLPYVVSLRGSDVPFYNPRFKHLDRLLFKRLSIAIWRGAAAVVANSAGLRDLALESSPGQRIGVIPNGIDIAAFACKTDYTPTQKLRLLVVSRLILRKGISYLIEAVRSMPSVRLQIVGDGPLLNELKEQAAGLDVAFSGLVPHGGLPAVYQNSDVFVLPSLNEGMSNTVLEAMASGLPLILTDTGGTEELIDGNGFIVPLRDSPAIELCLRQFQSESGLIEKMGRRSRQLAETMAWRNVAEAYLKTYRSILV